MSTIKPVEAIVEKITRSAGKNDAQVVIRIPAFAAATMAMGPVSIVVEPLQKEIDFGGKTSRKERIQADRG
jgi:hypothetical protein